MRESRSTGVLRVPFRLLTSSLSLRLFLWLTGVTVVAFAAYAFVIIRTTSRQWEQTVLDNARRFSDLIQSSTHYSMLLNRKEDVRHIVQTISREPGVEGVRVYDKGGNIVFSGSSEDVGRQVDLQVEACIICHGRETPLLSLPTVERVRIFRSKHSDRHRVLGLINPIENSPDCSTAACHAHSPDQSILGVLDVKMSLAEGDRRLETTHRQSLVAAVLLVVLIGISSATFLDRTVRRPVRQLIKGSQRVAQGDLSGTINIEASSEIGELGQAFNDMTHELQQARQQILDWSQQLETRVHEQTADLEAALNEIQELELRKSHYMRISAHQLRSPLATVKTSLQVLTEGYRDPSSVPGQELLQGAVERVDSLLAIVNDLLGLARIREGQTTASWTRNVDVGSMLQEILEGARPLAVDRRIRVTADVTEGAVLSWGVLADLRFALENVVDNAIKYSHPGGEVQAGLVAEDDLATLTVADHGIGIPLDLQRDVFLEFVRAPNARHHAPGTGLGLTIVKAVVEGHGGTVSLHSEPGCGTTVSIGLHLHNAAPTGRGGEEA